LPFFPPPMAEEKLLDVSRSGGLSLGSVAALLLVVLVYIAPAVAAFTRLGTVEKAQEAMTLKVEERRVLVDRELAGLDKRTTRTEDRWVEVIKAIESLGRKLEDRTVYAKGRAE
jgi:hypothetical protein